MCQVDLPRWRKKVVGQRRPGMESRRPSALRRVHCTWRAAGRRWQVFDSSGGGSGGRTDTYTHSVLWWGRWRGGGPSRSTGRGATAPNPAPQELEPPREDFRVAAAPTTKPPLATDWPQLPATYTNILIRFFTQKYLQSFFCNYNVRVTNIQGKFFKQQ